MRSFLVLFIAALFACADDDVPGETSEAIVAVQLSPAEPTRIDDIHAEMTYGQGVDENGLEVAFAWYLDDTVVSNEEVFAAYTATMGQTVYVVAEAQGSSVTSETVEIANAPPDLVSLTLSPEELYTNDTVSVVVEATDPDGQDVSIVSYDWRVNDVSVGAADAESLDGTTDFESGDSVAVEVTVSDGTDETALLSEETVVLSTPPTAP